jgi:hypothetical protein
MGLRGKRYTCLGPGPGADLDLGWGWTGADRAEWERK